MLRNRCRELSDRTCTGSSVLAARETEMVLRAGLEKLRSERDIQDRVLSVIDWSQANTGRIRMVCSRQTGRSSGQGRREDKPVQAL